MPDQLSPLPPLASFATGSLAAMSQLVLGVHPLDRIKTFQQANLHNNPTIPASIRSIYSQSGWKGFYAGLGPAAPQFCLKNGYRWCIIPPYTRWIDRLLPQEAQNRYPCLQPLLLGSLVGASEALLLVCPSESLKIKAMTTDSFNVLRFLKSQGCRRLFDGWDTVVARQMISLSALYFGYSEANRSLRRIVGKERGEPLNAAEQLVVGGTAGLFNALATIPLDVAKTQAQKQDGQHLKRTHQILSAIYRRHGASAFTRGLAARALRNTLWAASEFFAMAHFGIFLTKS